MLKGSLIHRGLKGILSFCCLGFRCKGVIGFIDSVRKSIKRYVGKVWERYGGKMVWTVSGNLFVLKSVSGHFLSGPCLSGPLGCMSGPGLSGPYCSLEPVWTPVCLGRLFIVVVFLHEIHLPASPRTQSLPGTGRTPQIQTPQIQT